MEKLLAIASTQYGLFTRMQAHRCGVTDKQLQYRVRNHGLLEQISRHVYRVRGTPIDWRHRVLAACFTCGPKAVASHRCAAELLGFDAIPRGFVEVTVPRGVRVRGIDAIVHESLDLARADCTTAGPIPVTTAARTLIDLGAVLPWHRVEEAFDGAERDVQAETMLVRKRHTQVRRQGRNGVGPMAVVLKDRDGRPPKWVIERRFLRLLERAGLPKPERQYELLLPSGHIAFMDAAYVAPKLGWELDGHGAHATRRQRAADNARASEIADLGWQLRRFTWEQVTRDGASAVRSVRSALASSSCDT